MKILPLSIASFLLLLSAFPAVAQSPHDVTTYGVVYRVPEMSAVVTKKGLIYATEGNRSWRVDVFLPPKKRPAPAVVFVNGVGGALNEWEIYKTWGQLVAAHGLAGITYEAPTEAPAKALPQVIAWIERDGPALGLDPSRIAIWSCSANVTAAMAYQMEDAPKSVRAAVVYYGAGDPRSIRSDLPVYSVLAGRDSPGLIQKIRALWTRVIGQGAPWTMVDEPSLTHAFDGLDEGVESRRVIRETLEFLVEHLEPQSPGPAPSLARTALTHMFGQELPEATATYRQIVSADPKDHEAQRLVGITLMRQGKAKEAVVEIRNAIAAGDESPSAYQVLAQALMRNEQPAEAIDAYERVLKARGPSAGVLYDLACAYALTGKKQPALDNLAQAVAAGFRNRDHLTDDPDLASLHDEPRYKEIVASLVR